MCHPFLAWPVGGGWEWVVAPPGAALWPALPDWVKLVCDTFRHDPGLVLCPHVPAVGVPGPGMVSSWCAGAPIGYATWAGGRAGLVACEWTLLFVCAPTPIECGTPDSVPGTGY
jgi:hypothetical protein